MDNIMSLEINLDNNGLLTIQLPSTLDAVNASNMIETSISAVSGNVESIQIEMSATTFMDSAGVGCIVKLYRKSKEYNIDMKLIGAHGQPLSLIQSLQIDRVIEVQLAD